MSETDEDEAETQFMASEYQTQENRERKRQIFPHQSTTYSEEDSEIRDIVAENMTIKKHFRKLREKKSQNTAPETMSDSEYTDEEEGETHFLASEYLIQENRERKREMFPHQTMSDSEEDNEIRDIVAENMAIKKHFRKLHEKKARKVPPQRSMPHPESSDDDDDQPLALPKSRKKQMISPKTTMPQTEPESMGEMSNAASEQQMTLEGPNDNMTNMFASVWVKVEVNEDPTDEPSEAGDQSTHLVPKKKKQTARRPKLPILKCELCDYTTSYNNCLKLHMIGHGDAKPFACDSCDYTTKYPVSLSRHVLIQHKFKNKKPGEDATLHKCDQCEYTSYFYWNLSAHKRVHRKGKIMKCEDCSYETPYRHHYVKHKKRHDRNKQKDVLYKCDKCTFETKFEGHIARHLARIHNEVSDKACKCDFCDFTTTVRWRLNIHKQKNKQEEPLKCSQCDFETYYKCEAKIHKKQHIPCRPNTVEIVEQPESNNDPVYQSNHERKNHYIVDSNNEIELKSIQVIDTGKDQPFRCTKCTYSSKFKASVQRHFQRHHTDNTIRPYKCCNCDFSTKTKDQITLHNKRSQSITDLSCNECDFITKFKCQLVMHQKLHYPHKCVMCNYVCKQKHEIEKHFLVVHMGDGLKCKYCDYKASRKESLLVHETMHTGDKPFKCEFCNYQSVRASLLDKHRKRYHNILKQEPVIFSYSKIESLKVVGGNANKENPIEIQGKQEYGVSMEYLENDTNIITDFMAKSAVNS